MGAAFGQKLVCEH